MRRSLCDEARRLARLLVEVAPLDAEAHGLAALMDLQASRIDARIDAAGDPVLLLEQDRTRWDAALIRSGLASLETARRLTPSAGFHAALPLVDALADEPALRGYHYVASVRADLLGKLGRHAEARAEYTRAAALTINLRERAMLLAEASRLPLSRPTHEPATRGPE